ncbi:MAG: hypothetical protein JXA96_18120 [Sedimentisphaerales bacterium]|nr:hypothetical protein [Sedimentisphaerales bacterium]
MIQKKMMFIIFSGLILLSSCQNKNTRTELLSEKNSPEVFVFYFHRTVRCSTCLEIEAGTAKVLKENFPQFLAEGFLKWVPFNMDDDGGEEFAKQFDIDSNTLVLVRISENKQLKYKKLEDVWEFVGNPEELSIYVTNEINEFMNDI